MPYTQVANLDFEDIKQALRDYLRAQTDFTDYDFEGSALSTLIDTLAYNTYYTAFNTNMVVNELFIDSATLRDNVVALAKQLGYRPKSITSPTAYIDFSITYKNPTTDRELFLKKGTGFVAEYDNNIYQYVVLDDVGAQVVNDVATFTNIAVREGTQVTSNYTVNTSLKSQRFILDNRNIDTNTIKVRVFPTGSSTSTPFLISDNILGVDGSSQIFFLDEIEDERYEIIFGDGVIGQKLENNSRVEISYVTTSGKESNGVKTFVFSGVIENESGVSPNGFTTSINSVVSSSGGEDKESIDRIKYNAPKAYGTQNRAVTENDYDAIVRKIYPSIGDIIIFGGEKQDPPEYGKVFMVIKPTDASYLTNFTKQQIVSELKKYTVASIQPVIVDPSVLFVELRSKIFYNGIETNKTQSQIRDLVIGAVQDYAEKSGTEKFSGKFRYSKFIGTIDSADASIKSNLTEIVMRKDFYPKLNISTYYELCFLNAFDKECDGPVLSSTAFRTTEFPIYDSYLEDRDGKIVLYRLDNLTGDKIILDEEVGVIDYAKGEVMLYDLTIIRGSFVDNKISIRVKPLSNDVVAMREVYLDVDVPNSSFTAYKE